ncbi:MAG: NifB/NifX family molybdenum-iron cluster-binding protein [Acidobacteriota bacterium]|jgi:predicted Fe-Mo cluster-binding NifX family protein|nr:NifB/NifX family molybdenum-iron cluster-binding protein [Acidobacteriota bacterium]
MKVLITAEGKDLDANVDPRFGRAAYFLVVDTDSNEVLEAVSNGAGRGAAQGAGVQAAQTAARLGVSALISGHCGPNAFSAMQAANIAIYTGAHGTVRDAIDQLRKGELTATASPDVRGHW